MKIKTEIMEDGTIACETQIDSRHYRSRYRGYTLWQAKRRFVVRMEAIYMCLHCDLPASKCKGKCKYETKNGKKISRGKRVI